MFSGCGTASNESPTFSAEEAKITQVFDFSIAETRARLGNAAGPAMGSQSYSAPTSSIELGEFYLVGQWSVDDGYIETAAPDARLLIPYYAKEVYLTAESEEEMLIRVLQDAQPLPYALTDRANPAFGLVQEKEEIALIKDGRGAGQHTVEIFVQNAGLKIYEIRFE